MSDNLDDFDETKRLAKEKKEREAARQEKDTLSGILAKKRQELSNKKNSKFSKQYLSLSDETAIVMWKYMIFYENKKKNYNFFI